MMQTEEYAVSFKKGGSQKYTFFTHTAISYFWFRSFTIESKSAELNLKTLSVPIVAMYIFSSLISKGKINVVSGTSISLHSLSSIWSIGYSSYTFCYFQSIWICSS